MKPARGMAGTVGAGSIPPVPPDFSEDCISIHTLHGKHFTVTALTVQLSSAWRVAFFSHCCHLFIILMCQTLYPTVDVILSHLILQQLLEIVTIIFFYFTGEESET